ncbi:MAG: tRNA (adenosine(37)-N6)-threonylcarbamoyltransferase complex transferase subunit TsaD [Candidatus Omnitrophica bacterium]|nr:tRNA (adenosine(37)-N6)-threonylcarbamoyltransferase complex transferase subunit TsaD [Candidatus Omnitrophota bacterium]
MIKMNVLGIETSCDETSVAVVQDGRRVLSNTVASSLRFHKKYGGVIPEIASRMQLELIAQVAEHAIQEAGITLKKVDLVAVTSGPGLLGSLFVGISFAKALSLSLSRPLVGVNHVYSHIYANFLESRNLKLPFVALVVSGGHTSLFYVEDFHKILTLGQTQDDACGEAFDKVAKILGLGYPGGPLIERLAQRGDSKKVKFSCSGTDRKMDFSFSGIKTAVLYYVRDNTRHIYKECESQTLSCELKRDIAASFQKAVTDVLIKKSFLACRLKKTKTLIIGGGVAANSYLREKFNSAAKEAGITCYFPSKEFCLDNAAMVAGFGYQLFRKGKVDGLDLNVELN